MNVCMLVTNSGVEDPRVCMEAEALAREGHSVTVIAWDREADHDAEQRQNDVDFVRLKLHSTHGRGVTQPVFIAGFWLRAWRVIRQIRPDVVHCHDLDTLPLGWYAARCLRVRLVFDAHENFPDMMTGYLPSAAVTALRALERHLVPRCDVLITVGERLAGHYRALGAGKVVVVGNWKDPADFRFPPETIRRTREELGLKNGVIAISFVANLGRERHLEPLLAAVAGNKPFACVIGGDGFQAEIARRYAAEHDNIIYLGRVPLERVPLVTAACDIVYSGYDDTSLNARWGVPNKLYEAIAAGKPLLANDFGELGEVVRHAGCGILTDTRTPEAIASALEQLASPDALTAMGRRASALQNAYQRDEAVRRLTQAYAQTILRTGSVGQTPVDVDSVRPHQTSRGKPRLLVALAGGGFFLETQRAISELPNSFEISYVTLDGLPYRTHWPQLDGKYHLLNHYDLRRYSSLKNAYRIMTAIAQAYTIMRDEAIDGVLTAGVNIAIPLAIAARLRGLPFVFVESVSRVTRPSITGRVVSLLNLADRIYVQWPEARRLYRGAVYEGAIF